MGPNNRDAVEVRGCVNRLLRAGFYKKDDRRACWDTLPYIAKGYSIMNRHSVYLKYYVALVHLEAAGKGIWGHFKNDACVNRETLVC